MPTSTSQFYNSSSATSDSTRSTPPAQSQFGEGYDWVDNLSPNEPGLPVHLTRSTSKKSNSTLSSNQFQRNSSQNSMSAVEVVDSSSARRRGAGQALVDEVEDNYDDEYDKGMKERDRDRPVGIGMESRYAAGSNKDSDDYNHESVGKGKWDKLIPRQNEPATPVSPLFSI